MPVWPTWSECGRQPALVTAREQPTAPPSSAASSSITAKPSAEPTPRPPETTTSRVGQRDARAGRRDALGDARTRGRAPSAGRHGRDLDVRDRLGARPRAAATVSSSGEPWTRASSSRLPPQRIADHGRRRRRARPRRSSPRSAGRAAADVREHLVAAVGARARATADRRARRADQLDERLRPRRRGAYERAVRRSATARDRSPPSAARERERLQRELVGRRPRSAHERASDDPDLLRAPRPPRAPRPAPLAEHLRPACPPSGGSTQPDHLEPRLGPRRCRRVERLALGAQPSRAPTGSAAG